MTSLEELAKFYGGPQWQTDQIKKLEAMQARTQDDQIDMLKYNGTVTGRMSGGAGVQNIEKPPQMEAADIDLLNPLIQPTLHARQQRRREALDRLMYLARVGMQQSLDELADVRKRGQFNLSVAEKYKTQYQFTQEEIDARYSELESHTNASS